MNYRSKEIRTALVALLAVTLFCGLAAAETRTFRQVRDVAVTELGNVRQFDDKADLFEFTFNIDQAKNTITRTRVQRLDQPAATSDATVYNIMQKGELLGSPAGNGGKVLIAIRRDGGEILELGHRFAFTMRISPFSQVITGIYHREFDRDHEYFPGGHGRRGEHRPIR
ncbi:MAG TPA: hypothetical protein VMD02_03835 [Candidatus Omnitrophota bacterium]|nr:hypothetical protein [Candidatus Omnitrophota bacterium]